MSAGNYLKRSPSIHSRLLLGLVIPLTVVAALVSIETFLHARKTSSELHDRTLLSVMLVVSENVLASEGDLLSENILEALTANLGDQFFYHVSAPDQAFVVGYSGIPSLPGERPDPDTEPYFYDSVYQGDPVRAVTFRQLVGEQEFNGWMTVTAWQRVNQREALALDLFARTLGRMLLIVICAGIIVWFALSYGLKPLDVLRRAIERRTPDDLTPIQTVPPVEVKNVVASMNRLFGQVAKANRIRERFIGDAAHQMRNPIAAIKTQSETALRSESLDGYRESLKQILRTTEDTGRLVEQLLITARAHAQNPATAESFALEPVVRQIAKSCAVTAVQKGYEFAYESGATDFRIKGYPLLFGEAIANLIDNAVRHTPTSTQIVVGVANGASDNSVRVFVADEGPMFSEAEFSQLLKPFTTGDSAMRGSGLGLTVVDDIARLHGGRLSLIPGPDGRGKQMSISLPTSAE